MVSPDSSAYLITLINTLLNSTLVIIYIWHAGIYCITNYSTSIKHVTEKRTLDS